MNRFFRFNRTYLFLTMLLFVVEVMIAICSLDKIVRSYVGDFLVVMLIYCFIRSFIHSPFIPIAGGVLLFSYVVEMLQYFHLLDRLGLRDSRMARMILGISFSWMDMLAYTLGILVVLFAEFFFRRIRHRLKTTNA